MLTGEERRTLRGEERDELADLLRASESLHRDARQPQLALLLDRPACRFRLRLDQRAQPFGFGRAGQYVVDGDAVGSYLQREELGVGRKGRARHGGQPELGRGFFDGGREHGDDAPEAASTHIRQNEFVQPPGAVEIEVEGELPLVVGEIEQTARRRPADVVDDDVRPPPSLAALLDDAADAVGVGHVRGDGEDGLSSRIAS